MSKEKGWIKLYRSILDHHLWNDKPFAKGQAWTDLILLANHQDTKVIQDGEVKLYKKGTVNRSILELSKRWGWDRRKVKRFLDGLEMDRMLSVNSTTHGTTITIVNYSFYNCDGTTDGTTDVQPMVQPMYINKNEKNEKKVSQSDRQSFGTYNNVYLTQDEFTELQKFDIWEEKIERRSVWKHNNPDKKTYSSDFATIKAWCIEDQERGDSRNGKPERDSGTELESQKSEQSFGLYQLKQDL